MLLIGRATMVLDRSEKQKPKENANRNDFAYLEIKEPPDLENSTPR